VFPVSGKGKEKEKERGGELDLLRREDEARVIYRHYATLYFV
jgi:hypothetical protein